jgi:hypothetical protein
MHNAASRKGEIPSHSEGILKRFEDAWRGPERPDLESYRPTPRPGNTLLLFELVHIDLDFRLRHGEPARVEQYLERYPGLKQDRAALLELIVAEYTLRRCWQTAGTSEEYLQRFPQYLQELRDRLASLTPDFPTRLLARRDPMADDRPTLPGYQLVRELGRGGMGIVYEAEQTALGRVVALKTLLPGYAGSGEELELFRREAEAIARLDHPHIVPVYEVGKQNGRPYFSMKLYSGGSLAQQHCGPGTDPRAHAAWWRPSRTPSTTRTSAASCTAT